MRGDNYLRTVDPQPSGFGNFVVVVGAALVLAMTAALLAIGHQGSQVVAVAQGALASPRADGVLGVSAPTLPGATPVQPGVDPSSVAQLPPAGADTVPVGVPDVAAGELARDEVLSITVVAAPTVVVESTASSGSVVAAPGVVVESTASSAAAVAPSPVVESTASSGSVVADPRMVVESTASSAAAVAPSVVVESTASSAAAVAPEPSAVLESSASSAPAVEAPGAVPVVPAAPAPMVAPSAVPRPVAPRLAPVSRAGPQEIVSQLPASAFRWLDAHGWKIEWRNGPGPGRVSEAQYATSTIVIWYTSDRSDRVWAGAVAHELGHAVSYVHFTNRQMTEWNQMRGLSSWRWVPGTRTDFTVGEGDFAEAFMSYLLGHEVRSVGGPLTASQRAWISANTPF